MEKKKANIGRVNCCFQTEFSPSKQQLSTSPGMPPDSLSLLENSSPTTKESTISSSKKSSQKRDLSNLQRIRLLGSGKTADVYLCTDPASPENSRSFSALKVFKPDIF